MTEIDLDREELACAGLLRANDDDDWRPDAGDRRALAGPPTPKRRIRRPTLESQLREVWKAARAAGVHVAVTVEVGKVTATPVNACTNSDINEWDRDLGTNPPSPRQ